MIFLMMSDYQVISIRTGYSRPFRDQNPTRSDPGLKRNVFRNLNHIVNFGYNLLCRLLGIKRLKNWLYSVPTNGNQMPYGDCNISSLTNTHS